MTNLQKRYYASKGSRIIILFGAIFNFVWGLRWLYYVSEAPQYAIAGFVLFYFICILLIFYYYIFRFLPIATSGLGWIVINHGSRNTGPLRSKHKIKNILIRKTDVEYAQNGIFSLMITTSNNYRYYIYYLTKRERDEITQRLFKV